MTENQDSEEVDVPLADVSAESLPFRARAGIHCGRA